MWMLALCCTDIPKYEGKMQFRIYCKVMFANWHQTDTKAVVRTQPFLGVPESFSNCQPLFICQNGWTISGEQLLLLALLSFSACLCFRNAVRNIFAGVSGHLHLIPGGIRMTGKHRNGRVKYPLMKWKTSG